MKSILLIEPDKVLADVYRRALAHAGYKISHSYSAQEAIDAADKQQPALVILETQIAEHDGIEFLHEFRSYPEWKDIPVIVNSRLQVYKTATAQDILKRDFGVVECLYKPQTTLAELLKTVKRIV